MMKRINLLIAGLITLATTFCVSCSDEGMFRTNEFGSQWEESGKFKLSTFTLPKGMWDIDETVHTIRIRLQSHTDSRTFEFDAKVHRNTATPTYSIYIPKAEEIPDSDYELTASLADGTRLGTKLTVSFQEEMLYMILGSSIQYTGLQGEGTQESPYLIGSQENFADFEYNLYRDTILHGSGLYFKQTASFEAPPRSDAYEGRLYAGCAFAGIYDGGNHQIEFSYIGNKEESDQSIGLFSSLLDGAQIRNLSIDANIQGVKQNGGALAGEGQGTIILNDIQAKGFLFESGDNIGGFIGFMNGNLTANDCRQDIQLKGTQNVGGMVGQYTGGTLTVNDYSNLKEDYSPMALSVQASGNNAGALCGTLDGACQLRNITFQHSISEEDKNLPIIYTTGDGAGGIFGTANIRQSSHMENVKILCPVRADGSKVGGLIGNATLNDKLSLQGCQFASYAKSGNEHAGGFFGYLKSNNHLILEASQMPTRNNRIVQVENGYLAIEAEVRNAGGMFGYLEGDIQAKGISTINVDVKALQQNAGGIAGKTHKNTIEGRYFSLDSDMTIRSNDAAGGLVGAADHSTIRGSIDSISFDKITTLPKAESFESNFSGNIEDSNGKDSGSAMGGIVGYAYNSLIEGLCFSGSVFGRENVGGIVGYFHPRERGSIINCVNRAEEIKNTQEGNTGGIIGVTHFYPFKAPYYNLINYVAVSGKNNTGGIIGYAFSDDGQNQSTASFEYMVNVGNVSGSKNVGGCIGRLYSDIASKGYDKEILNSANYGEIKASEEGNVGGIIGQGDADHLIVKHCANHGKVSATAENKVGGIAGRLGSDPGSFYQSSNMELAYCCNRGEISSTNKDSHVGGLLGYQEEGDIDDELDWMTHDCYNMGNVSSDQDADNGGIIGCVDHYAEIRYCINVGYVGDKSKEAMYGNGIVGTRKSSCIWYHHNNYFLEGSGDDWCADSFSEKDKTDTTTFENFNFDTKWTIDNDNKNNGYPYLRNCPFQFISK